MDNQIKSPLYYQLALTMLPKIGGITAKKLIAYCGGVEGVFDQKKSSLLKIPGIGETLASSVIKKDVFDKVEKEIKFIDDHKIETLFYTDSNYPARLKHCEDGPILLFYKGKANLNAQKVIGIVGTRSITEYGKQKCSEIIEGLKKHNPLIISGLAYGVDTRAHRVALELNLETIGVLGHGLDRIYPPLNRQLAEKMVTSIGGLLTDFVSKTNPDRENFPKRNRIIAGMIDALIVVEAAITGGALITANIANTYNRDVFAIPGRTTDTFSQGCNHLIKTNKAHLVETAADIEYIMSWESEAQSRKKGVQQKLFVELTEEEKKIAAILLAEGDVSVDLLVQKTGFNFGKLSALLLTMEFNGVVAPLPGKLFRLTAIF